MSSTKLQKFGVTTVVGIGLLCGTDAYAQPGTRPGVKLPAVKETPPPKPTPAQKAAQAVLDAYTDAANFQNNGAFPLAIGAWERLLKAYPQDALSSKARHYLGICYAQIEKPDYDKAIQYFREALNDPKLDIREETLVKLGQALYDSGMQSEGEAKKKKLAEAAKAFGTFLEQYADGSYADQATFYAGEAEYQLGRLDKAANLFRRLADQPSLAKSELRPDALFALAVIYEDQSQSKLAVEAYEKFIQSYAKHRLLRDARLRLAELYLSADRSDEAAELLKLLSESKQDPMLDYILYRQGYALAKSGKYDDSSKVFQQLGEQFPKSKYAAGSLLAAGQALMREKKYDEATAYFRKLLGMKNDSSSEAAHLLCQIAMLQGKAADAVSTARDALQWSSKSPRYPALKMDLAEALAATSDGQAEAKKLFEQIANEYEKDPIASRAAYNAAFAALQAGAAGEAKRWGEVFAKRWPQDPLAPDVAYITAEAGLQLGNYSDAATAFEQLIKSQPDNPSLEAWELRLGHAYYMDSNLDKVNARMMKLIQAAKSDETKAEAYFLIGAGLLKQEKFREAQDALRQSIDASSKWPQADETYLMLSQAEMRDGNNQAARETLDKLRKKFPKSRFVDQAEFRIGQLSAASGDFKTALASYQRVLDSDREKSLKDLAVYGKAWVFMQQSNYAEALKLLETITTPDRPDAAVGEAVLARAVCLRSLQKADEAAAVLEKLVADEKNSVALSKSLYELGLSYTESKKFDKASATFDRLAKEFPQLDNLDKVIYELAWARKEAGQAAEADAAFNKLVAKFPDSSLVPEAQYHLGQQAYDEDRFEQAIALYSKALASTEDKVLLEKLNYKLGWSYFQRKDYQRSAAQFAKQTEISSEGPLAVEGVFMHAESMMKAEKFAEAFDLYKQARKAFESSKEPDRIGKQVQTLLYLHGAQSARELKKWKEVDEWLATMLKRYPESEFTPFALYEQAYSAQSAGNQDVAIKLYEQVADSNRNEIGARARFMMGELYFGEKDYGRAVPEFEKVVYGFGAKQASPEVRNWQARAAFEAGRCSEVVAGNLTGPQRSKAIQIAVKYFQAVIDDHPGHELEPQAKTRLAALAKLPR